METYEKYLDEGFMTPADQGFLAAKAENDAEFEDDVDDEGVLSVEDIYKLRAIAMKLGSPETLPLMKRVAAKVYQGTTVSAEKEKAVLIDVLKFFLSPEKAKYKTILSKF